MFARLERVFGKEVHDLVFRVARAAEDYEVQAYLVGGVVRDLLLGIRSVDIDFMLEGDAPLFVDFVKENWTTYFEGLSPPGKPIIFPRYKTAKLQFRESICSGVSTLDFAMARREVYPESGAQPIVSKGDLYADLHRRDFSINAMALRLNGSERGAVCDFFDGQKDLEQGLIKILHQESFEDDPARMIRAVRFLTRFGFSLDRVTEKLFTVAVEGEYLERLPRFRLFDEFRKALEEKAVGKVLQNLLELGLLPQVVPRIRLSERICSSLDSGLSVKLSEQLSLDNGKPIASWQLALGAVFSEVSREEYEEILTGFDLHKRLIKELVYVRELWREHCVY